MTRRYWFGPNLLDEPRYIATSHKPDKPKCWTLQELREAIERFHAEDEDLNHPDNYEGTSDCGNCYSVDRYLDWLAGE